MCLSLSRIYADLPSEDKEVHRASLHIIQTSGAFLAIIIITIVIHRRLLSGE
jgi:hypothetical protein